MVINLKNPTQNVFNQLLPLLLSFLDDALLLWLSNLGFHVHWLKWLSPVILIFTFLWWAVQLMRYVSEFIRNKFYQVKV